jgi:uncharacterized protein YcbK (DUF882 family)
VKLHTPRPLVWASVLALAALSTGAPGSTAGASTLRQAHAPARSRPPAPARFFFAGNGHLRLGHAYFDTTLDVRYRRADGTYDPAALEAIRHFFRSREDGREAPISLRLIELLAYIQDRFHPRQMTLVSGYRSPEFNADLRAAGQKAAQASLHTEGLAADIAFAGVDLRRLWLQLREARTGGVGYYRHGNFLHIDTGRPRFWEETTSRVDENLAAGNARVFLRTDFDRYASLVGATLYLHSVTTFPVYIASQARLVGPQGTFRVDLRPAAGEAAAADTPANCFASPAYAEEYAVRVTAVTESSEAPTSSEARSHVVMLTCAPRVEQTPPEIESNPIELRPH